jgi:hypothetical protein
MSSAICFNQKPKDAEYDIAPQMKKMKLNNSNYKSPESDTIMSHLGPSDPLENLKTAFPSISENVNFGFFILYFLLILYAKNFPTIYFFIAINNPYSNFLIMRYLIFFFLF